MTYLIYVKCWSWSDWTYYGMDCSFEHAVKEINRLKITFYNVKCEMS